MFSIAHTLRVHLQHRHLTPDVSFLALRITWINWLCAPLILFALPVILLESLSPSNGESLSALELISPSTWSWRDSMTHYPVWLPLVFAAVLPTVVHVYCRNRLKPPFAREPRAGRADEAATYRTASTYLLRVDSRVFAAYIDSFVVRLVMAMVLAGGSFLCLRQVRFVHNFGCLGYPFVVSIPEYVAYLGLYLVVVVVHMPSPRQVFGWTAKDFHVWRKQ